MFKDKAYEITNIELLTELSSYSSNASSLLLEHTEQSFILRGTKNLYFCIGGYRSCLHIKFHAFIKVNSKANVTFRAIITQGFTARLVNSLSKHLVQPLRLNLDTSSEAGEIYFSA